MSAALSPRNRRWQLFGVVALAVGLRLPGITASFYGDEKFSVLRDANDWITASEDRFRPVFFTLLHLWRYLGFQDEGGLRALPFFFGVLQIPAAFVLGRMLEGRRAAIAFSLLLAVNPLAIEFSQELRMYSLVPLLALLQACAFVGLLSLPDSRCSRAWLWTAFTLASVAGVYTHFHYWLLLVGFGGALLYAREQLPLRHGVLALAAIAVAYLPNISNLLRFERVAAAGPHLVHPDLASALPKVLAAFTVGFNYFELPDLGIDRAIRPSILAANLWLSTLALFPAAVTTWHVARLHATRPLRSIVWLPHALFGVPVLLSFGLTVLTDRNFVHPKYMVFSAPFLLLLLVAGYLSITLRWLRVTVALSAAAVCAVAIAHFWQPRDYGRRADWRGAAAFLRSRLDDRSVLLGLGRAFPKAPFPRSLWEYYAPDLPVRKIELPRPDAVAEDLLPMLERVSSGARRVCYLREDFARNVNDPQDIVVKAARLAFGNEEHVRFNPRLEAYCWMVQ
jgi:hypothetical protein